MIYEVGDQDVDEVLEDLRERNASLVNVDGEAQPGHFILADLQQVDAAGFPVIGVKHENQRLQIALPSSEDEEITKPLVGARVGDTRRITFYDHHAEGKPGDASIHYQVTVKEISEKKLPPLNDEFAREMTSGDSRHKVETLDELRKRIHDDLVHRADHRSRDDLRQEIIDELLKINLFDLPDNLTESFVQAFTKSLERGNNKLPPEMAQEIRPVAIRRLRWEFLFNHIAEVEKLEVSDDELREHIIKLALSSNEEPQRLINQTMNDEDKRENIREKLLEEKVLQYLEGQMKIREQRVPFKDRDQRRIITA
jgi:trigger factor